MNAAHTTHSAATQPHGATAYHPAFSVAIDSDFAPPAAAVNVPWDDLMPHRTALIRFAQRKLQDPMLAEDVVHDVFEAVISGRATFAGRSALRSWLTAILKHKIVDLIRSRAGLDSLDAGGDDDEGEPALLALECPGARPDEIAEQRELLAFTLDRISALPAGLRDVMTLRVLQDRSTEDVCRTLSISEDNLFVRLHRARKQLLC